MLQMDLQYNKSFHDIAQQIWNLLKPQNTHSIYTRIMDGLLTAASIRLLTQHIFSLRTHLKNKATSQKNLEGNKTYFFISAQFSFTINKQDGRLWHFKFMLFLKFSRCSTPVSPSLNGIFRIFSQQFLKLRHLFANHWCHLRYKPQPPGYSKS